MDCKGCPRNYSFALAASFQSPCLWIESVVRSAWWINSHMLHTWSMPCSAEAMAAKLAKNVSLSRVVVALFASALGSWLDTTKSGDPCLFGQCWGPIVRTRDCVLTLAALQLIILAVTWAHVLQNGPLLLC